MSKGYSPVVVYGGLLIVVAFPAVAHGLQGRQPSGVDHGLYIDHRLGNCGAQV